LDRGEHDCDLFVSLHKLTRRCIVGNKELFDTVKRLSDLGAAECSPDIVLLSFEMFDRVQNIVLECFAEPSEYGTFANRRELIRIAVSFQKGQLDHVGRFEIASESWRNHSFR